MLQRVLIAPFLIIIKIYQIFLSPIFALKTHGLVKGLYLSLTRISKCHPWGDSGYDPVPDNNTKKQQK